jgi:hypothetical protein
VLDARRVADAIVRTALSPKPTTTVGSVTNATRLAHLLAPNLAARALGRFMDSYFRHAPMAAISSGNLHEPPAIAAGIDGGFRSADKHPARPILVALTTIAALAAVATAASGASRRSRYHSLHGRSLPPF